MDREAIDKATRDRDGLVEGLSGAQWGAAMSLASSIYMRGVAAFEDEDVKDRRIQVSKSWPKMKGGD